MDNITSNCTSNGRESCDGRLRYSAEHWIHSHPTVEVSFLELRLFLQNLGIGDLVIFVTKILIIRTQ
jgi:hypothetical protein